MEQQMSSTFPLPVDVFLDIFPYLSIQDVMNIRQTCKDFLSMTRLRSVWKRLLDTHVLAKNIPVPGLVDRPIDTLSAEELERLTCRALRLRRNWSSPSPVAANEIVFSPTMPKDPLARHAGLYFLPGRGNRWLLSVTFTDSMFLVQCWDVGTTLPTCIAAQRFPVIGNLVVNTDPTSRNIFALQRPFLEVFAINLSANDPGSAFISVVAFREKIQVMPCALTGSTIVTRQTRGSERLFIWDIDRPDYEVELVALDVQPEKHQATILQQYLAIVVTATTVAVYPLASFRSGRIPGSPLVLQSVAHHRWQWKVDSVCMSEQVSWTPRRHLHSFPVNILLRFASSFPWPTNMLHHFVLEPNKLYKTEHPMDANNLSYQRTPELTQTIDSPVRMFASSQMTLGKYGTAVWFDSHTEDYFGLSDQGQRLAGRLLRVDSRINHADSSVDGMVSTVFRVKKLDQWLRLAIDEEEGRIGVGCTDGDIVLFEYI